jgi:hypothetical protein
MKIRFLKTPAVLLPVLVLSVFLACDARLARAADPLQVPSTIKHRFLAIDESRNQMLYVDQFDPAKDWTFKFTPPMRAEVRDIQLIGQNRLLLSMPYGYAEFDLATQKILKEVKGFSGVTSAQRQASGATILGGYSAKDKTTTIYVLDAEGKVQRKATLPSPKEGDEACFVRMSPQGTVLLAINTRLIEADLDGKKLKDIAIPDSEYVYQIMRKPNGNLLLAAGGGVRIEERDPQDHVVKTYGGRNTPEAKKLGYFFFGGFQVLKNGHVVVTNWNGHGAEDSRKGVQMIEFDPSGAVVWTWHDPARAGSLASVIVLDDLDTNVLNDDVSGVMGSVSAARHEAK